MQREFVVEAYEGFEGPDLADNNMTEECEEDSAEKYRKLLNLVAEEEQKKKEEEPDVDMEITWELGSKVEILNCVVYLQKEGGATLFYCGCIFIRTRSRSRWRKKATRS